MSIKENFLFISGGGGYLEKRGERKKFKKVQRNYSSSF
jgi:phage repressor protein C with HTH and peptisase S24 domain